MEQEQKMKEKESYATIVRIMQTDIPGNKKLIVGLTYIKGVSWKEIEIDEVYSVNDVISFLHKVCICEEKTAQYDL